VRALRELTLALGAVLALLSLWVVVQRFRYPIDGEWMTGGVRDGVERLRDGGQLYLAPSARFVPFSSTPLYFWVCSFVARFCSTVVACKLVSISATIATGWGIFRISRALGATGFWCDVALILHVATYSLTDFVYDLERVDAFYAALVVLGVAAVLGSKSIVSTLLGGALLGLSFFAKQAGVLAFGAVVVGLLLARERRRALILGLSGVVLFAGTFAGLDIESGGWFHVYCLKLPHATDLRAGRAASFFIVDLPKAFAITAGSIGISVPVLWSFAHRRRCSDDAASSPVVLAAVIVSAMAASFWSRATVGGWPNELVAWLPLGCAATAVAGTRAEQSAAGTKVAQLTSLVLLGGVCIQILAAMFDPLELGPDRSDLANRARFIAGVRRLEQQGEVIVTTAGDVTLPRSFHAAALHDFLRAGHRAPDDLLEGLARRRYAAIFLGHPDEFDCELSTCNELSSAIIRNYFVAARRHERNRTGTSGYDAGPRWLLRPRRDPLAVTLTTHELVGRQRIERGFAEMKSATSPTDVEVTPFDEIEALTERELSGGSPSQPEERDPL
jgi:hypothetical protein